MEIVKVGVDIILSGIGILAILISVYTLLAVDFQSKRLSERLMKIELIKLLEGNEDLLDVHMQSSSRPDYFTVTIINKTFLDLTLKNYQFIAVDTTQKLRVKNIRAVKELIPVILKKNDHATLNFDQGQHLFDNCHIAVELYLLSEFNQKIIFTYNHEIGKGSRLANTKFL
ncbi:MAG: hypothetical protein CMP48_23095 [Rickettsiales bacterium]|nr:hypothetical protein [Rickettsiales bacterium]